MVSLLYVNSNTRAATRLEEFWEDDGRSPFHRSVLRVLALKLESERLPQGLLDCPRTICPARFTETERECAQVILTELPSPFVKRPTVPSKKPTSRTLHLMYS